MLEGLPYVAILLLLLLLLLESVPKAYAVVRLRGRLYRNRSRYFAPVSRRSIN